MTKPQSPNNGAVNDNPTKTGAVASVELEKILLDLQTSTLYADNTEPAMTNNRNIALQAITALHDAEMEWVFDVSGDSEEYSEPVRRGYQKALDDVRKRYERRKKG